MENKLRKLFDYQKFSGNAKLDEVIGDVEERYHIGGQGRLLSDEELSNAAGGRDVVLRRPTKRNDNILP